MKICENIFTLLWKWFSEKYFYCILFLGTIATLAKHFRDWVFQSLLLKIVCYNNLPLSLKALLSMYCNLIEHLLAEQLFLPNHKNKSLNCTPLSILQITPSLSSLFKNNNLGLQHHLKVFLAKPQTLEVLMHSTLHYYAKYQSLDFCYQTILLPLYIFTTLCTPYFFLF